MKNLKLPVVLVLFFVLFVAILPKPAYASYFGDIANGFKELFHINGANTLALTSSVALAPYGDLDKNKTISSGDIIKFVYIIKNQTKNSYKFATLKTSINTKQLNSLRNVQGTTSLNTANNTIVIPNLQIDSHKQRTISFEARINYYKDKDLTFNTIPVLYDMNNMTLVTASKQEVIAKKMTAAIFQKFTNSKK